MKTELYKDTAGEWRFRIKADNGEVVAVSEGYHNLRDAMGTAHKIQPDATMKILEDENGEPAVTDDPPAAA